MATAQETRSPTNPGASLGKNILNDADIVLAEDGHGYIFNPYNPDNREITLNDVQSILSTYGVPSKLYNFELYRRAFIHASYTKRPQLENARENIKITPQPPNCMALRTKSNERLEFLGDGVLECVTKYYMQRKRRREPILKNWGACLRRLLVPSFSTLIKYRCTMMRNGLKMYLSPDQGFKWHSDSSRRYLSAILTGLPLSKMMTTTRIFCK